MKKNLLQLFADDSAAESTDTQGEAEAKPSESEESKVDEAKRVKLNILMRIWIKSYLLNLINGKSKKIKKCQKLKN